MQTQVNPVTVNAIIKELQGQRNEAFNRAAVTAGQLAEAVAALEAAQTRIKELEAAMPKDEEREAA